LRGRWASILQHLGCRSSPSILTAAHQVYLSYLYPVEIYCPEGVPTLAADMVRGDSSHQSPASDCASALLLTTIQDVITLAQWRPNEPCFTRGVSRYHEEPFFQCRRCGVWEAGTTWQQGTVFNCSVCCCVQVPPQGCSSLLLSHTYSLTLVNAYSYQQRMVSAPSAMLQPPQLSVTAQPVPIGASTPYVTSVATPFSSSTPNSLSEPSSTSALINEFVPSASLVSLSSSKSKWITCPKCRHETHYDPIQALNNFHQCSKCNTEYVDIPTIALCASLSLSLSLSLCRSLTSPARIDMIRVQILLCLR